MKAWNLLLLVMFASVPSCCLAGETKIVLREYLNQQWTNELLTYPFSAPEGQCRVDSVTLTDPLGQAVPAQLSEVELWPGTQSVKTAKLSFIADLAPLAADAYTVRYGDKPGAPGPASDLKVRPTEDQVEVTTGQFGARLLLGEKTFPEPVAAPEVPGPIAALRLADGTWFGGSRMYGPGKLTAYSARLTDQGPVFAGVAIRYTYEKGNTMDVSLQIVAGDNTIRCETNVKQDQPDDGFRWVLSRGLPPLVFQVQMESYRDREQFPQWYGSTGATFKWAEIPLADYVGSKDQPGLVTQLSPWEDWFSTYTQTRIRLKLENTTRELQIRSLDSGAWVEPIPLEKSMFGAVQRTPANSFPHKLLPVTKEAAGEITLQVNAAAGKRMWTVSECLSMPGVASLYVYDVYKPESTFPPETRPTVSYRLNEVKDYVLQWPGDAGKHPRLFISKSELEAQWRNTVVDQATIDDYLKYTVHKSEETLPYEPKWDLPMALGAYLLSRGDPVIVQKTLLPGRLRKALDYELWGMQFGNAGNLAPILYDAMIDTPFLSEADRAVQRSRMAYFGYRLADPRVWSFERGYCSGNPNMTHTWELSRGLVACTIPEHPMAKTWFRNAELILEQTLTNSVGPAGEFTEPIGRHGRVDTLLVFAIASTRAGLHDYSADPRLKRLMLHYVKMLTPRDPRPRLGPPDRRYLPAWGRDGLGGVDGTVGVMARFMRRYDPEYSAHLQWAWLEGGANPRFDLLGGFERMLCDRQLPAKVPPWTSEVFPRLGTVMRHGLGAADEHQVALYAGAGVLYPSQNGAFASIFAYGKPLAGSVAASYEYQEGFLTCHVDLARPLGTMKERQGAFFSGTTVEVGGSWLDGPTARFGERGGWANVGAFSALPRQDYASVDVALHHRRTIGFEFRALPEWPPVPAKGEPPVDWRRQALFLKDDDPAKTAYLLIRDSVKGAKGPQPTMWQMWTVSETLDTPDKVQDVAAVLAGKPGYAVVPARELKGDRFTAIGQLGVDVEYYVASPTDTSRHTLRWGTDMTDWANKLGQPEYQDLLHLQMPGDGAYFVAFYPRKRDWPAPTFSTLGDGLIIKVSGDFGTDYGFLSALEASAEGEGAGFRGTAGSVQDRKTGLVLSLGAAGEVRYKGYSLTADFPAALRAGDRALTVELPATLQPPAFQMAQPFPGGTLTVSAPGEWKLAKPVPGVRLTKTVAGWSLTAPAGVRAVSLVRNAG